MLTRNQMAWRAARELADGDFVNLGIGLPTLVASYIPADIAVTLHSENGILGVGPYPTEDEVSPTLVNAGKETVTLLPGGSFFDSALSFGMIRGGHIDWAILGAMEVSEAGDLANWMVPGEKLTGMGGAMDLAAGARRVLVLMNHTDRKGRSKVVKRCSLPLTAPGVVDVIVSELGVMDVTPQGLLLREVAPGETFDSVQARTDATLIAPEGGPTVLSIPEGVA